MSPTKAPSATSRVFLVLLAAVILLGIAVGAILVWDTRRASYAEAERTTHALATVLADFPEVRDSLEAGSEPTPESSVQSAMERVRKDSGVSYITVMTTDGVRLTHRSASEIGHRYRGTIPDDERSLTEEWTGTLGRSVRTIVPVYSPSSGSDGRELVGWVSVGITVETIGEEVAADLPVVIAISIGFAAIGVCGALIGRGITRRVTGDLSTDAVRDAVSSYESMRTLGDAMRAQTHEHGNRLHAALGLLELGRVDDAKALLAETSHRSQVLVDQVTNPESFDPTVSALILGKTSQALERQVQLETEVAADAPRSALGSVDLVSVIGNLLDNALDAAAVGSAEPRLVRLRILGFEGDLRIEVTDSGDGIPEDLRDRVFEWGFSTKPRTSEGHGVGLALVSRIVSGVGGTLEVTGGPTRFVVTLPAKEGS